MEWCTVVESRRNVVGGIKLVVNVRGLSLEYARVLHEGLLVSIFNI